MMRLLTTIAIAFAIASCGREHKLDLGEFTGYVEKFQSKAVEIGKPVGIDNLKVQFGDTGNRLEVGLCVIQSDSTPTITIQPEAWNRMTEPEREALMFHELGHCVLGRVHKDSVTDEGIPSSVMNTYTLDGGTYETHEEYYAKELFTGDNQ